MDGRRRPAPRFAALLTVALTLSACADGPEGGQPTLAGATLTITTDERVVTVEVEVAETEQEKSTGLMFRETLADDAGMVFLEEEPARISFTMRNTLIPLSLAVWGPDGRIRSIIDMDPCREEPCPTYDPGAAWVGALEVNQGFFEEHGVEVGDLVRLER